MSDELSIRHCIEIVQEVLGMPFLVFLSRNGLSDVSHKRTLVVGSKLRLAIGFGAWAPGAGCLSAKPFHRESWPLRPGHEAVALNTRVAQESEGIGSCSYFYFPV